jgi:hypothetical protein
VIERLLLKLERVLCIGDLPLLRKLDANLGIVVPLQATEGGEPFVDLIAQRDFDPLQWPIQGLAESGVPHVEAQRLRRVAGGDRDIALQANRRHAAGESRDFVNVVLKRRLQLSARSL